ncbi:hypothetical protein [Pseudomonas sp. BN411]|uniref:hypothetical protein n=1 Tax=Pseudomonas sp. BN411 TaxID=2567887 RepID=UPI002456E3A7|nr:hypothetical protein [Pseudomonas sp. BN411]
MKRREFPGYVAWSTAEVSGGRVLAFVAIRKHGLTSEPIYHLVCDQACFKLLSDAASAAEHALSKILRIDQNGTPIFSSPEC